MEQIHHYTFKTDAFFLSVTMFKHTTINLQVQENL